MLKTNNKTNKKTSPTAATGATENAAPKRFKRMTEYGRQLHEKQKVRDMYGMREKQFRRFFGLALRAEGASGENLLNLLERRLDNVVFRLKLASTRAQARQVIVHGHIKVNGRKVTSPSYLIEEGDLVALADSAKNKTTFVDQVVNKRLSVAIKVPDWLELVKGDYTGRILRLPVRADIQVPVEEHLIVELYSK